MNENTYEKSLVKIDNNIFSKIKMFFRNLLKNNNTQEKIVNQNILEEQKESNPILKTNFINNIKIQEKKVNLRLKKMQKDLENGNIMEEDLCEQELQELRELYLQQIEEKKQSIENYKNRILKIKAQLS